MNSVFFVLYNYKIIAKQQEQIPYMENLGENYE